MTQLLLHLDAAEPAVLEPEALLAPGKWQDDAFVQPGTVVIAHPALADVPVPAEWER